ncbi:MAG: MFS transporter [Holophaga sp.]|nr:MFS transporter [Holophaga sp.]
MENTALAKPRPEKWSRYKYIVILLLFLGWTLGSLDRTIIYFAVPSIIKEFHLSATQMGLILSAFFAGYTLMQFPGGMLADRFGPRNIMLVVVFVWSVFTGLTGLVTSFTAMLLVRFAFGVSEGPFQMSAGKAIAMTYRKNEIAKATSIMLSSGGFVACLGPIIVAAMIARTGWRQPFFAVAFLGLIVIVLFYLLLKPEPNPGTGSRPAAAAGAPVAGDLPFKKIFRIPMIWSLVVANFTAYTLMWGLGSWMPTYLMKFFGINIKTTGWLQSVPGLAILVSVLFSGFIIDRLSDRQNKYLGFAGSVLVTLCLFMMYRGGIGVKTIILIQTFISLALGYVTIYMPCLVFKKIPVALIGRTSGTTNGAAQLGSFFAPAAMGLITDLSGGRMIVSFGYLVVMAVILAVALLTMQTNIEKDLAQLAG